MERDWRSDKISYSRMWSFVVDDLERRYPGRFVTLGDVDKTTDAEFLAMPGIGPKKLAMFRAAVEHAKANKISAEEAMELELQAFEQRGISTLISRN